MANNANKEPSSAPQPNKWYNLTLGSSFTDASSSKFCTLRYEFKPASIDKIQPGSLHKTKDNRVTVEFQNNQPGKPKVTFEGSSEDYKDNDAVLFFDGHSFRLERLHRAVKRLRHVRLPGESSASATAVGALAADPALRTPPHGKPVSAAVKPPPPPTPSVAKAPLHPVVPVEVERIDVGDFGNSGTKTTDRNYTDHHSSIMPTLPSSSPIGITDEFEKIDVLMEDDDEKTHHENIDINVDIMTGNRANDTDDEIADVDVTSDNEMDKGPSAADFLRAQVNAQVSDGASSSSSGSSGSGSSGSGSGSKSGSSSDSEGSDDDSVNSVQSASQ